MKYTLTFETDATDNFQDLEDFKKVLAVHDVEIFFYKLYNALRDKIKYSHDANEAEFADKVVDLLNKVADDAKFNIDLFRS